MSVTDFPKELQYNKEYSWVKTDKQIATVGIVGPAATNVKEFVFINLPEKGKEIQKGDTYVSVEAVKWSGHLSSPVSGKIIEVNDSLFDEPSAINTDPYGSWIMKVELQDPHETEELMDAQDAKTHYQGGN